MCESCGHVQTVYTASFDEYFKKPEFSWVCNVCYLGFGGKITTFRFLNATELAYLRITGESPINMRRK